MSTKNTGLPKRASLLATKDLERIGFNPIEALVQAHRELDDLKAEAFKAYKSMRGYGEKNDAGVGYLSNAIRAVTEQGNIADKIARYKHPQLAAIAVKDLSFDSNQKAPISTQQAIDIIKNDPFAPKDIPTSQILDAAKSGIHAPFLPSGVKNTDE